MRSTDLEALGGVAAEGWTALNSFVELRQYIVAVNNEERPFTSYQRRWV